MPSFFVYGIPPVDRPDAVLELKHAIVSKVRNDPYLLGKEPIFVFFPADRDTLEIGECIFVTSTGFAHRLWDTRDHVALRSAVLVVVRDWVLRHLPKCNLIEVDLDRAPDITLTPLRWTRPPHK